MILFWSAVSGNQSSSYMKYLPALTGFGRFHSNVCIYDHAFVVTISLLQEFGFINGVDNVNWPPYRDSKS